MMIRVMMAVMMGVMMGLERVQFLIVMEMSGMKRQYTSFREMDIAMMGLMVGQI